MKKYNYKINSSFNLTVAKNWQNYMNSVRNYFNDSNFLEVQTPHLVSNPGMEPSLEPFSTVLKLGERSQKFYLPTSPELHLKKLLCAGYENIFEIKKCFRNDEITAYHQPEFWMIEWYRSHSKLNGLIDDLQNLMGLLGVEKKIKEFKIPDLFKEILDFQLKPETTKDELAQLCIKNDLNISIDTSDSFDDYFFILTMEFIEPYLKKIGGPVTISDYPPSQAALARFNDNGFVDRFEFYMDGIEIANAFYELTDPVEQKLRMDKEIIERERLGKSELQIDESFIEALEKGMPETSGIALGLDRLFMSVFGVSEIEKTRAFSIDSEFID